MSDNDMNLGGLGNPAAPDISGSPLDGTPPISPIGNGQTALPLPPPVPGNHAGLFGMLSGLGVAISAAAKSMATGGKQGGAPDVNAWVQQQQQEKRAKEDQNMRKSEFELRTKAMTAKMQQDTAIYNHNVSQWPAEDRERQLKLNDATVDAFTKEESAGGSMGYDMSDPTQKAEFEKRAGIGSAAQQPGAIVVPMTDGHGTGDAVSSIRKALPDGKNLTDYIVMPNYTDKTMTMVPKDSPTMTMSATPRQVSQAQAETENALTIGKAAGLENNNVYKQLESKYSAIKDVIAKGGKPSAGDLWSLHMNTVGPLSTLITGSKQADAIAKEKADTQKAKNEADPLFKMENDPAEMQGEKSSAAISLLTNKIGAETDPAQKIRETRLLSQAKMSHSSWLADEASKERAKKLADTGTPQAAGKLLANGDLTLADMKSRGMTTDFVIQATNEAKKIDPKYNASDEIVGEKALSNVSNQTFYGSAGSLLHKGGLIDQLEEQGKKLGNGKIPIINNYADLLKYHTGDPALSGFKLTLMGLSDDGGKVMGGGQATDSARDALTHDFTNAQNDDQRHAAAEAFRNAVKSQVKARVGSNRYIAKRVGSDFDYGQNESTDSAANPYGATPRK